MDKLLASLFVTAPYEDVLLKKVDNVEFKDYAELDGESKQVVRDAF